MEGRRWAVMHTAILSSRSRRHDWRAPRLWQNARLEPVQASPMTDNVALKTGNLDDTQLRLLEERLLYLRELEDRRATILQSIDEQGKLTEALRTAILAADAKQTLEDLYLPYKPKRRTRAQMAREAGLQPLADALLADPTLDPHAEAAHFVDADPGVADVKAALDGARDILSEQFGETAELLGRLRDYLWHQGRVMSSVVNGKENEEGEKFRDYYDYAETIKTVPSHRALALLRGRNAGVL
ncbi:hypothetical protein DFQ30_001748, partial [Apophysomyces sp. BC1015]